jgi:hypothetical protein
MKDPVFQKPDDKGGLWVTPKHTGARRPERGRPPLTPPTLPRTLAETGLSPVFARDLFLKTVLRRNLETQFSMSRAMAVTPAIVQEMIDIVRDEGLIEIMGETITDAGKELRYKLSDTGKARALDALEQNGYFGTFPVPMEMYAEQIKRQMVKDISVSKADLDRGFADLVVNNDMVEQLGPAMNSGRSILLYGPPGNGKSSLAMGMRTALDDRIFVPRTLEYNSNIISVYDPLVHGSPKEFSNDPTNLRRTTHEFDPRYVLCKRPTVITGGELRLEMLELKYNAISKTYEAPLQLKSTGGIFIVDDLGRQVDSPQAMINRWITPMETSFDILTLATGEKMTVPFDTLVVFSTNYHPNKLFDQAALRRIYYKLHIDAPSRDEMLEIWVRYAQAKGIALSEDFLVYLFTEKYKEIDNEYAAFHAAFLVSHMRSLCEFRGYADACTPELLDEAWEHLRVKDVEVAH